MVVSLSSIYASAFDDYRRLGGDTAKGLDTAAYFEHAAWYFVGMAGDPDRAKLFRSFAGFVENIWREGNEETVGPALRSILPVISGSSPAKRLFEEVITEEFHDFLQEFRQEKSTK